MHFNKSCYNLKNILQSVKVIRKLKIHLLFEIKNFTRCTDNLDLPRAMVTSDFTLLTRMFRPL